MSYAHLVTIAERAGSYFFTPGAMRFFNSRVLESSVSPVWNVELGRPDHNKGYWFVTSERQPDFWDRDTHEITEYPRLYTVRRGVLVDYVREDGRVCQRFDVDVIEPYQGYATAREATKAMRELIAAEQEAARQGVPFLIS